MIAALIARLSAMLRARGISFSYPISWTGCGPVDEAEEAKKKLIEPPKQPPQPPTNPGEYRPL